jgi:hypothetical protein
VRDEGGEVAEADEGNLVTRLEPGAAHDIHRAGERLAQNLAQLGRHRQQVSGSGDSQLRKAVRQRACHLLTDAWRGHVTTDL